MKLLVTGAGGQLGLELTGQCQSKGFEVLAPPRSRLNIIDLATVKDFIDRHRPSLVINAAAYTNVDAAESEKALAFAVNKTGCANLARICAEHGIALMQISTDYVFDGNKGTPYSETDPVAPLGVYGRSKADGESAVRATLKEHIIMRSSWLYGFYGRNFVKTILQRCRQKEEIRVVADQHGSPTSAIDLAEAIVTIANRLGTGSPVAWGTYHYCGSGITSWHEFAQTIVEIVRSRIGIQPPRVVAIKTTEYPARARRPAFSALDCSRIQKDFGIYPKPWRQSLETVIQKILAN